MLSSLSWHTLNILISSRSSYIYKKMSRRSSSSSASSDFVRRLRVNLCIAWYSYLHNLYVNDELHIWCRWCYIYMYIVYIKYMLCIYYVYIDIYMSKYANWGRSLVPPPDVVCLRCLRCSGHIPDMAKFCLFRLYIYMKYAYFLEILANWTPE